MIQNETLHLLILHESQDIAEQLLNRIRNSGRATRAQLIESEQLLKTELKERAWDFMLLRPEVGELSAINCLLQVKKLQKDIPALLLIDEYSSEDIIEGLQEGFAAVIPTSEEDWILQVIRLEWENLVERRKRRRLEIQIKEIDKRCEALLESSRDAITYVIDGMITYANPAYLELFGYEEADELEGMPILDMVASEDQEAFRKFLKQYQQNTVENNQFVCQGLLSSGDKAKTNMTFEEATYDGESCTQIMIRTNQADAELQEKLKEISSQDLLTGLFNRQYFNGLLEQIIEWVIKENKVASLLYVQIDSFSSLQEDIGVGGADIVLSDIASILRTQLEDAVIARYSDDIFAVILKSHTLDQGGDVAETIRASVDDHLAEFNERTIRVTVSIGVTLISEASSDLQEIISHAHEACGKAQQANDGLGNSVNKYELVEQSVEVDETTRDLLAEAIDHNRFKLLFQPIIDIRSSSEGIYEVLLRMLDEDGELVSPDGFLQVASREDLSQKIDRWVILQAIKMLAEHREAGHQTCLALHLTGESLKDKTLLPWLSVALKAARMPGDAIIFQISETDANTYLKQAREFTHGLHELHCRVAISNFGCALNPFHNLKYLQVDFLKLDGSFVNELNSEESRQQFRELVQTAHAQGKLTIAPFVESASVLSALWQIGVNYIQGYYLQEPTDNMNYDFSDDQ